LIFFFISAPSPLLSSISSLSPRSYLFLLLSDGTEERRKIEDWKVREKRGGDAGRR
jgi:hypothetical protein